MFCFFLKSPPLFYFLKVREVCALYQAACTKNSTDFGGQMAEKGGAEVAATALSLLEAAVAEAGAGFAGAYLARHAQQHEVGGRVFACEQCVRVCHQLAVNSLLITLLQAKAVDGEGIGARAVERTNAVRDLRRPFAPGGFKGCCVCWGDEDESRNVLCDTCDCEFHLYCLDPPLADVPQGVWHCPRCRALGATPEGGECAASCRLLVCMGVYMRWMERGLCLIKCGLMRPDQTACRHC